MKLLLFLLLILAESVRASHPVATIGVCYEPLRLSPASCLDFRSVSSIVLGVNGISKIIDRSPNGNHFWAKTDAAQPLFNRSSTNQLNGLDTAYFDGTAQYLAWTNAPLAQPVTVVTVIEEVTYTNFDAIMEGMAVAFSAAWRQRGTSPNLRLTCDGVKFIDTGLAPVGAWFIGSVVMNGVSSMVQINNLAPTTGDPGVLAMGGLFLGSQGAASYGNIRVAAFFVFTRSLNAGEVNYLVTHEAKKAGIILY